MAAKEGDAPSVAAVKPNEDWNRRRRAAERYRPKRIRLLLIAEAPPTALDHYFYFAPTTDDDEPFRSLCDVLFEEPSALEKPALLKELRRRGVFLVDLRPDAPLGDAKLDPYVDWLLLRLEELHPEAIVLIGTATYEAAQRRLAAAMWPVSDVRVPSPSADEVGFRRELRTALVRAGLEKLIRPMPRRTRAAEET
jgi:hypothetical protein